MLHHVIIMCAESESAVRMVITRYGIFPQLTHSLEYKDTPVLKTNIIIPLEDDEDRKYDFKYPMMRG